MTSVQTNNGQLRGFFLNFLISNIFGFFWHSVFHIRFQAQEKLKQSLPSRPPCNKVLVDPVGMVEGAHNAKK